MAAAAARGSAVAKERHHAPGVSSAFRTKVQERPRQETLLRARHPPEARALSELTRRSGFHCSIGTTAPRHFRQSANVYRPRRK